jgi:hypothetical protein
MRTTKSEITYFVHFQRLPSDLHKELYILLRQDLFSKSQVKWRVYINRVFSGYFHIRTLATLEQSLLNQFSPAEVEHSILNYFTLRKSNDLLILWLMMYINVTLNSCLLGLFAGSKFIGCVELIPSFISDHRSFLSLKYINFFFVTRNASSITLWH